MEEKKLKVEREEFVKDNKTYFSYFIRGVIRGKEVKVAVIPPDRSGYSVLDIVFGDEMQADLVVTPFEMKDESTGRAIKGNTYSVRTADEDGEIYECKVKPYRYSDKALLNMILR